MAIFSNLVSIVFVGLMATFIGLVVVGNLAYMLRRVFTWRDPGLGWSPTQRLDASGWTRTRRSPDLNVDMVSGLYRD